MFDVNNIGFLEGLEISAVAMLGVFVILTLIFFILNFMKYLPQDKPVVKAPSPVMNTMTDDDSEERVAAMIVASITARKQTGKDVHIKSIERIK